MTFAYYTGLAIESQQMGGMKPVGHEQDIVSILRKVVSVFRSGFHKDEDSLHYDSGGGNEEENDAKTSKSIFGSSHQSFTRKLVKLWGLGNNIPKCF